MKSILTMIFITFCVVIIGCGDRLEDDTDLLASSETDIRFQALPVLEGGGLIPLEEIPVINIEIVHTDDEKIRWRLNATPAPIHGDLVICIDVEDADIEPTSAYRDKKPKYDFHEEEYHTERAIVIRKNQKSSKEFEVSLSVGEWQWVNKQFHSTRIIGGTEIYSGHVASGDDSVWVWNKVDGELTRLSEIPRRGRYRTLPVNDFLSTYYYWDRVYQSEPHTLEILSFEALLKERVSYILEYYYDSNYTLDATATIRPPLLTDDGYVIPTDFMFSYYHKGDDSRITSEDRTPRPDYPGEVEIAAVVSVTPASGDFLASDGSIKITFDRNPGKVNASSGTVQGSGRSRTIVAPAGGYRAGAMTVYIFWVNGGADGHMLNYMVLPPDFTPPAVTSSSPKHGAINVDPQRVFDDGIVVFSTNLSMESSG